MLRNKWRISHEKIILFDPTQRKQCLNLKTLKNVSTGNFVQVVHMNIFFKPPTVIYVASQDIDFFISILINTIIFLIKIKTINRFLLKF